MVSSKHTDIFNITFETLLTAQAYSTVIEFCLETTAWVPSENSFAIIKQIRSFDIDIAFSTILCDHTIWTIHQTNK